MLTSQGSNLNQAMRMMGWKMWIPWITPIPPPYGPANGPSNGYNKQLIEASGAVNEGDETLVSELHQSVTNLLTIADIQCKPTPFRGSCSNYDLQPGCLKPS